MLRTGLAALLLASLLAARPVAAELVAERITSDNAARLQLHGPDADGGVDDFALQNGTLCAVIAGTAHCSTWCAAEARTTSGARWYRS